MLTSILFIFFDNFFKVAFVYACLLLWNTNAIFPKQHQKLYHISKAQLSTFSYGHPNILSKGKRSERRGKAPFLLSFWHAWVTKSDQIKSKVDEAWINRQTILTGAINSNSFQLFLKQKERKWWYEKMHFLKSSVDSILEFICSMRTYILG